MSSVPDASTLLLDTGPLLALVNRRDRYHEWARDLLAEYSGRLITCEAVISEAWFLAQSRLSQPAQLLALLKRLPMEVLPTWGPRALELVRAYQDRPMDIADAGLVVLVEKEAGRVVVTIDMNDFSIYRMHGQQTVPALTPPM